MKKSPLVAVALLIVCSAAPVHAYVQPSEVIMGVRGPAELGPGSTPSPINSPLQPIEETIIDGPNGGTPTQPVPEPGTMALASMGLLALGAAIKKKRGR